MSEPFKREGSPYYWYDFAINGLRFRGSTKTDGKAQAKAVIAKLRNDAVLGQHFKRKPRMTLNNAMGQFWMEHGQFCQSGDNAMHGYSRHILSHFGKDVYLDELGDAEISNYKSSQIAMTQKYAHRDNNAVSDALNRLEAAQNPHIMKKGEKNAKSA